MSVLPLEPLLDGATLRETEAREAMDAIIDGRASSAETTAFLTALAARARRGSVETAEELVGLSRALEPRMRAVRAPRGAIDTCGTGGSGRAKLNVGTLVAITVASLGQPVAKHGNRSSVAIGSSDVLDALGLAITEAPETAVARAERTLAATGLAFLHAPHHHPALAVVAPIRKALGFRTIFNLLGPLVSPARVTRQLVGVSDPARVAPMAAALARLGRERALVVGGAIDELVLETASDAVEIRDGAIAATHRLDPRAHGVHVEAGGEVRAGLAGALDVLEAQSPRAVELVAWNAGVALALADDAALDPRSIAPQVASAREALRSGHARRFFERHRTLARDGAREAA